MPLALLKKVFPFTDKTNRHITIDLQKENLGVNDLVDISDSSQSDDFITTHEKLLLSNILKLRDIKVIDAMIPRADMIAIAQNAPPEELFDLIVKQPVSRIVVYNETLDHILGTLHIKDVLACVAYNKEIIIEDLVNNVPFVSPGMPILDVILEMRSTQRHMAIIVDEYGGVDGLVTINDVIEMIVGEIDDEHGSQDPILAVQEDGSIIADARYEIEDFEEEYGQLLNESEREEIETLGGLVYKIAGRIPARGEIIKHSSGMVFEILEADPRSIQRMRIRNITKENQES